MQNTKLINNILGWLVFTVATITYFLTLEPTVSWWDCGEFITSAFKLEVGHPPGAPTFMILGRIFTMFAPDATKAALMVNALSALASAGTVMILYWTIVYLARKLFPAKELSAGEQCAIWGSGLVGALAFTFTDSFWFSAVEGEVYALSSFFTALVFWAILKWETVADQKYSNRWLILIAYLVGLSIGVHLLNLLAIPAIGLVYYFKKYEFSWKGAISALLASMGILLGIQYGIIPGVPRVAFLFDRMFVNGFGLPFNSGILFMIVLIIAASVWGIRYTRKRNLVIWNTAITMVIVILIGYSSFTLILIRASANPPMNQNHPDNAFALLRYLNREQYGDRPLFFGQYYNSPRTQSGAPDEQYNKVDGKYKMTGTLSGPSVFDSKTTTFFPRMYSSNDNHIRAYKQWGNIKGSPVRIRENGKVKTIQKPTFGENLRFFFSYQLGHMYMRYFMWNFAGRQNDLHGHGSFNKGNWISGINFLDRAKTGPRENIPDFMKNDASRNTYYFLPLLFGLIGMFFQYNQGKRGKETFTITMLLFILTGIAIVVYLNQTPYQPRERDYAYAGSFYAFAIWIGLAVPALFSFVRKFIKGTPGAIVVTAISLALVPGILAAENWDDHDRSGKYMTRDYAINYLESCAPNAILFTYGDNDTFPLWYVQEVEGVRPDIKIVNVSYLGMDWYISQQKNKTYDADPVPFIFSKDKYYMGRMDAILFKDLFKGSVELKKALDFLGSDDQRTKLQTTSGIMLDFLPSHDFHITVNKDEVLKNGTVKPENADQIVDRISFRIDKNIIGKSEMAVLNIIAANNWERPIYIDHSLLYTGNVHFLDWLQFEGLAYRFVPIKTPKKGITAGRIDADILYENVMKKFVWGNVNDPNIHLDEYNRKQINIMQINYMFARLADALNREGKKDKAIEVLDKLVELFPNENKPYSYEMFPAAEQFYRAGAINKGNDVVRKMAHNSLQMLEYYASLPEYMLPAIQDEQNRHMLSMKNLIIITRTFKQNKLNEEIDNELQQLIEKLSNKSNG